MIRERGQPNFCCTDDVEERLLLRVGFATNTSDGRTSRAQNSPAQFLYGTLTADAGRLRLAVASGDYLATQSIGYLHYIDSLLNGRRKEAV